MVGFASSGALQWRTEENYSCKNYTSLSSSLFFKLFIEIKRLNFKNYIIFRSITENQTQSMLQRLKMCITKLIFIVHSFPIKARATISYEVASNLIPAKLWRQFGNYVRKLLCFNFSSLYYRICIILFPYLDIIMLLYEVINIIEQTIVVIFFLLHGIIHMD